MMEDPAAPSSDTGLERVPVLDSGTRIPVPTVADDGGKAKPSAKAPNTRAKNILGLLGELANMKEVSLSKAVRDRVKAITALVEIDLEVSESEPELESQSQSGSGFESESESESKSGFESEIKSKSGYVSIRPPNREYTGPLCIVQRHLMEDWRKDRHGASPDSRVGDNGPIIHAYYHQLQVGSSDSVSTDDPDLAKPALGPVIPKLSGDRKNLRRVVITSRALHAELEGILCGTVVFPIIVPPPFKILVQFLPQLRQRLSELKAELEDAERVQNTLKDEHESSQAPGESNVETLTGESPELTKGFTEAGPGPLNNKPPPPSYPPPPPPPPRFLSLDQWRRVSQLQRLIQHLGLLVEFVNKELAEIIDVRSKVDDGTLKEIQFEDLWHLFKPGDMVLSARGPNQQILKVCAVTGGQVQIRNYTADETRQMGYSRSQPPLLPMNNSTRRSHDILREEASGVGIWTPLTIDCYAMGFDGTDIGPLDSFVRIMHYSGRVAITDLDAYPLRFHPNSNELLEQMEKRGRKVLDSYGHKRYHGPITNQEGDETYEEIRTDIFIDMDWYYQRVQVAGDGSHNTYTPYTPLQPARRMKLGRLLKTKPNPTETSEYHGERLCQWSGNEVDTMLFEDFMSTNRLGFGVVKALGPFVTSSHLQLMRYSVVGYALRYRKWYFLDIDLVKEIDFDRESRDSGFHELVVPKRHRDLLVALVDTHMSETQVLTAEQTNVNPTSGSSNNQIDLVKGKGQGVIILLHGPPGSGKTSTAETIAAYTKRPLYSLTTGDIGVDPTTAERRLMEHAKQADKWGCVLLLDEGDVFLMQRDWDNLNRNALVSVFLRELEYYSGIMFLTTNRPGVLDEAFKSRIHITLNYPSIDLESTRTMWTNILNRLERENETNPVKVVFNQDELREFAERHYKQHQPTGATWNGRQIRNAFRTALALGHHERVCMLRSEGVTPVEAAQSGKKRWMRVRLTRANFKKIAKTSYEFEEYIVGLRGKDSDKARESEVRNDLFEFIGEAMQIKQQQQQIQMAHKNYGSGGREKPKQLPGDNSAQGLGKGGPAGAKSKKDKGKAVDYGYDDEDEDEEEDHGFDDDDDDVETDN